jgi:hypothetical protein
MSVVVTLNITDPEEWKSQQVVELLFAIRKLTQRVIDREVIYSDGNHKWDCDPALSEAIIDIGERVTEAFEAMQYRARRVSTLLPNSGTHCTYYVIYIGS